MCHVAMSGLNQLGTCTSVCVQQFLAKEHLNNKCLSLSSFCNKHNSHMYDSICIFFLLKSQYQEIPSLKAKKSGVRFLLLNNHIFSNTTVFKNTKFVTPCSLKIQCLGSNSRKSASDYMCQTIGASAYMYEILDVIFKVQS
jgi:hypothetical protein